jgi:hypothetical protein
MKTKNQMGLSGFLTIDLVYSDGRIVRHIDKQNLITLAAKQVLLAGVYLPNQTSDPVTTLWVGTGGTIDPEGQFPKSVSQSATGLFNPLVSVATSYTNDNTVPSVTFIADIDQGTANGALISEAGLFKASNLMFNIKTFPAIPKTSEFSIHFTWEIEMS